MLRVEKIFNKPPLDLDDEDIVATVVYFRHLRAKFSTMARERENEPKPTRGKKKLVTALGSDQEEL